jgi:serine/threonine-protein kinase
MPFPLNTNLGRYEVLSTLGAGGMGEVYMARDTQLNRQVALKVLPPDLINNRDRLRRFEQEAQAASALNHPNIITIYEIGAEGDTHFIAMEFIEGETLRRKLQTTRLEIGEMLNIAPQIAAALDAAHRSGIIHRDIKPENVMVREDGLVKVLDFGLAKLAEKKIEDVDSQAATRAKVTTEAGMILGTVAYMSPEQARGLVVDVRTDIFSLGVVLYEMLTGRSPFAGETTSDVIAAILRSEPAPPSNFNQEIPAELDRIVSKTLVKDCEERYQTAKDLLVDLRRLNKQIEAQAKIERTTPPTESAGENATQILAARPTSSAAYVVERIRKHKSGLAIALSVLLLSAVGLGYWFFNSRPPSDSSTPALIESLAVLPFVNASGNSDIEYLSDGMTESLINSLSQLPRLSVKARSSVFRYKGKDVEPQQVAAELSVQAILNGRFVLRGEDLTLYLSLVDARTGNQLWGEQYNRKLTDLVSLQKEIARDVSQKLRVRLSGADEQKLAKNYTENVEAYQLYLKGRYHILKLTSPESQKGISYFQQAIEIDPNYALAYVGLASAYRSLALASEMPSTEFLPKAKAAAQKAIEIDDTLADAHAELGFIIFWYDWDWNKAENQDNLALELNPNSPDAHFAYAHLLSNMGRHAEALAEIRRVRELDPLNLKADVAEGQFLIYAGQIDEALAKLQRTFEIDPNYWFAHMWASSAYIEKGMYTEAVAEARKARELSGVNSQTIAFGGYALAKSGKQAEARAVLEELLKLSTKRYVPPYNVALVYNSLGERTKTLAWLERGYKERDPRMVFLKVEPKWNALRDDPSFQDLLRRVGLMPSSA